MSVWNRSWIYHNAEETKKPGYLAARFDEIKQQQQSKNRPPVRVAYDAQAHSSHSERKVHAKR